MSCMYLYMYMYMEKTTMYENIEGASALVPPTPFYGGGQGDKQFAING